MEPAYNRASVYETNILCVCVCVCVYIFIFWISTIYIDKYIGTVVGKVTVTPLLFYITSYSNFCNNSNFFVTVKIAVTSNCSGIITINIR
jgi:hypothetical protein